MAATQNSLFKKIRRIQFQTTHLAEEILAGAYRSVFKGKGMEFEEVREYQAGDDVRSIDWNVTARMHHPFIKHYREERELSVTLAVDMSASTRFGSQQQLKSELISEIAAVLAFSAIKNNDKVALILFTDRVEKYLPPQKGTRHVLRVIRELLAFKPQGTGTDIAAALSFLGKAQNRRGICFLLSDFISADYSKEAAVIARKHDFVPVAILDAAEDKFPDMDLVTLGNLENELSRLVDSSSKRVLEAQQTTATIHLADQKALMHKLGTDLCIIHTNRPYMPELQKYFALRKKRVR